MMLIPGWLIALFTFPGVIVHEWAHKKFCDRFDVRVYKVVYFQLKDPAGYVSHGPVSGVNEIFWISAGPLVFNSIICVILAFFAARAPVGSAEKIILLWLAFAIGAWAFPSDHDAGNVLNTCRAQIRVGGSLLNLFAYPFFAIIWLANKLKFFFFDFIYSAALIALGYAIKKSGIF
jgi:Putative zincin peptidase